MLRLLPLLLFLVIAAIAAAGLLAPKGSSRTSPLIGHPLPEFSLPALEPGDPPLTPARLKGRPALINVFASWCEPCRIEHPLLTRLAREHNLPLYGIAWRDTPEKLAAYLARNGNPYTAVALAAQGNLTTQLGLTGVPETLLIDAQGIIRWKFPGALDETTIEHELLPLLQKLPPP